MCVFFYEKKRRGGCSQKKKKHVKRLKMKKSKFFIRVFFNFRGCRLQTSLLFLLLRYENKNASATHLHDLLENIPGDDFEEKLCASFGEQQRDEADSF